MFSNVPEHTTRKVKVSRKSTTLAQGTFDGCLSYISLFMRTGWRRFQSCHVRTQILVGTRNGTTFAVLRTCPSMSAMAPSAVRCNVEIRVVPHQPTKSKNIKASKGYSFAVTNRTLFKDKDHNCDSPCQTISLCSLRG